MQTATNFRRTEYIAHVEQSTSFNYIAVRMFLNGELMCLTAADRPGYWGEEAPKRTFELWSTWAMMTKEGDGMSDVPRFTCDELIIDAMPVGMYRIRRVRAEDYTSRTPMYKGYVAEPYDEGK